MAAMPRKPTLKSMKGPEVILPTSDDVRRAVVKEVVAILVRRREILLAEADQSFFHTKTDARLKEIHAVEEKVLELLPQGE